MVIEDCERLEASVDVAMLTFDDVMTILRTYVEGVLSDDEASRRLGLSADVCARSGHLLHLVRRRDDPDPVSCEAERVAGWRLHDDSTGHDKLFAAVVVLCTYDRDSAEFDTYGPKPMLESIMASICAWGEGYGRGFVDHARRSPPGQRCRHDAEGEGNAPKSA